MPTVNYYLNEKVPMPEADLKKIDQKAKGKTLTLKMDAKDVAAGKLKPAVDVTKDIVFWLKGMGVSADTLKLLTTKAKLDGKLSGPGDYEMMLTFNRQRIKSGLELVFPEVKEEVKVEPKYSFSTPKMKAACESKGEIIAKIESIAITAGKDKGHGPVEYLDGALHAHVTNTIGIAWKWKGDTMHVVAIGKKNNQNKQQQRGGSGKNLKTAQYDWIE